MAAERTEARAAVADAVALLTASGDPGLEGVFTEIVAAYAHRRDTGSLAGLLATLTSLPYLAARLLQVEPVTLTEVAGHAELRSGLACALMRSGLAGDVVQLREDLKSVSPSLHECAPRLIPQVVVYAGAALDVVAERVFSDRHRVLQRLAVMIEAHRELPAL
ncbi:hypothetical protein [Bailinhaonella thermotolerans]|uniref:Uncharacterized protein n=1 Tax=Bailinhaonella thermotolerans TaxID=1070861 RepID=A0A3A4A7V0_9ACTN|nr:hypothetical protein [Bailinhaonella thermotolerans]RJL24009.1 hypothetical protein D5H75_31785 [Bailinhaonella thermotolerans]